MAGSNDTGPSKVPSWPPDTSRASPSPGHQPSNVVEGRMTISSASVMPDGIGVRSSASPTSPTPPTKATAVNLNGPKETGTFEITKVPSVSVTAEKLKPTTETMAVAT